MFNIVASKNRGIFCSKEKNFFSYYKINKLIKNIVIKDKQKKLVFLLLENSVWSIVNYISLMKNHILEPVTIHGEGWINKWDVSKQTKNSIELVFKHNGKKNYPYAYKAKQTFKLKNKSLDCKN